MDLPISGKTYRFENLGASGRYLNLYSTGTASNGMIDAAFAAQMNKMIPIGTQIGEQSAVGLGTGGRIHLHFEVNKGRNSTEGNPSQDVNKKLPSISPYKYM